MRNLLAATFLVLTMASSCWTQSAQAQIGGTAPPTLTDLVPTTDGRLSIIELRQESRVRTQRIPEVVVQNGVNVTVFREVQEEYVVSVPSNVILDPAQTQFYQVNGTALNYQTVVGLLNGPTAVIMAEKIPKKSWLEIFRPRALIVIRSQQPGFGNPPVPPVPVNQVYKLKVPGTRIASIAELSPDVLKITHRGETTEYLRDDTLDDDGMIGYFSRGANQGIGWPADNQGTLAIISNDAFGQIQFRESQMVIIGAQDPAGQMNGMYQIQVIGNGLFLHDDGGNDRLLSTRFQPNDDFTRFILEGQPDGSYAVRVKATGLVWHVDDFGTNLVTTGKRADVKQAHFKFVPRAPGTFQIVSVASGKHLHNDGLPGGDQLLSTREQPNDNFTLFKLIPVPNP